MVKEDKYSKYNENLHVLIRSEHPNSLSRLLEHEYLVKAISH